MQKRVFRHLASWVGLDGPASRIAGFLSRLIPNPQLDLCGSPRGPLDIQLTRLKQALALRQTRLAGPSSPAVATCQRKNALAILIPDPLGSIHVGIGALGTGHLYRPTRLPSHSLAPVLFQACYWKDRFAHLCPGEGRTILSSIRE